MIRGYLYYSNQQPIMERNYTGPGRWQMQHAFCDLKYIYEGDTILIHMGHGQFHRFKCAAVDSRSALLIAIKL